MNKTKRKELQEKDRLLYETDREKWADNFLERLENDDFDDELDEGIIELDYTHTEIPEIKEIADEYLKEFQEASSKNQVH